MYHLSISISFFSLQFYVDQYINPFPNDKLKDFADDNFKFYQNGKKLPKQVENTEEKGEIAP